MTATNSIATIACALGLSLSMLTAAEMLTIDTGNEQLSRPRQPIDQSTIHPMACGPVSQMNAYRFSSNAWRSRLTKLPAKPDALFKYLRWNFYRQFSKNAYSRQRWEEKTGVRPDDLAVAINALHTKAKLPKLLLMPIFLKKNQSQSDLLQTCHHNVALSLGNGFPPILQLSRFVKIRSPRGGFRWGVVASHFVTIYAIEPEIHNGKFKVHYIDPYGGRMLAGDLRASTTHYFANDTTSKTSKGLRKSPCLEVDFPRTHTGRAQSISQQNALIATHLIYAPSSPEKNATAD